MSSTVFQRTIAHDHRFETEAAAIYGTVAGADDALRAIIFAISREPQSEGTQFEEGSDLYSIKVAASAHTRGVVVYYAFDVNTVTLMSIVETSAHD